MNRKQCTVYFEPEMWDAVQEKARQWAFEEGESVTASDVVRDAVQSLLAVTGSPPKRSKRQRKPGKKA